MSPISTRPWPAARISKPKTNPNRNQTTSNRTQTTPNCTPTAPALRPVLPGRRAFVCPKSAPLSQSLPIPTPSESPRAIPYGPGASPVNGNPKNHPPFHKNGGFCYIPLLSASQSDPRNLCTNWVWALPRRLLWLLSWRNRKVTPLVTWKPFPAR